MAMSGVELTDEAKITYEEIYKGKKHRCEFKEWKMNSIKIFIIKYFLCL